MLPADKKKINKGCWTCKDRKVRCDGARPSCANCARVKKTCQGYGIRLSWPKDGDTKRSIVGRSPISPASPPRGSGMELVHTSFFDMDMYSYLSNLRVGDGRHEVSTAHPEDLVQPCPEHWRSIELTSEKMGILSYFENIGYRNLSTMFPDPFDLRDVIVEMALKDQSITCRAVLHAILALASLQRDGLHLEAAKHKTAAVGALSASAKNGIADITEAARHVATNMLLCCYEIHAGADSHGHWPWYLMGARDIVKAANLDEFIDRHDIAQIVLWVTYHDSLARFSLVHWRRGTVPNMLAKALDVQQSWKRDPYALAKRVLGKKINLDIGPLNEILRYLVDVLHSLCPCTRPPTAEEQQEDIHACERGVMAVHQLDMSSDISAAQKLDIVTEFYRLAVLVYISRVCECFFGETRDVQPLVNRAFALIEQVPTCERLLPIFILGCEADTDDRRMIVLNLIRRTEENTSIRPLDCFRRGLDSAWIQGDLNADQDVTLDYVNKLSVIISSSPTLPTFV